jgi:hypothetical protein
MVECVTSLPNSHRSLRLGGSTRGSRPPKCWNRFLLVELRQDNQMLAWRRVGVHCRPKEQGQKPRTRKYHCENRPWIARGVHNRARGENVHNIVIDIATHRRLFVHFNQNVFDQLPGMSCISIAARMLVGIPSQLCSRFADPGRIKPTKRLQKQL